MSTCPHCGAKTRQWVNAAAFKCGSIKQTTGKVSRSRECVNREPLFQELQSAEARIKALESELDANGLVLQKLQDERDKALERVDRLEEFLGVSEQAKTECIFGKNQPMTNPLTKELNERFYTLSVMEALGSIAPDQLRELDELSAIRDQDPEYEELANERNAKIQALFDKLGIKLSIPLNFQNHQ